MKLRHYQRSLSDDADESGVMLVEPDDPEELVPLGAGEIGAISGAEIDAALEPSAISISWAGSEPTPMIEVVTLTEFCVAEAIAEWARAFQKERDK